MIFSSAPNDYLMHYGIKGQKWGIRRYQNPDGTLTAEGRRRYGYILDVKKQNIDSLNNRKKVKVAFKQWKKDFRRLNWGSDDMLDDITKTREADDKKKWGSNLSFKKDMENAFKKYVDYEKKGGYGPDYQDELLKPLYKKYPDAKDILDGMSFWEANSDNPKEVFNDKTYIRDDADGVRVINWIDNVWNNDYYYESDNKDILVATSIQNAARKTLEEDYYSVYGKEVVDKLKTYMNDKRLF